jgi:hypothetical protein
MTVRNDRSVPTRERAGRTSKGLVALLVLLAVGAVQGGVAMVADPLAPLGMPTSYLDRTPVDTYFWPGVFFLAIAAASLLTIAGLLGWRWQWATSIEQAIGYRWPWLGALSTGIVVLVFEIIELFLIPFHPVMHPLLIAMSASIIWLTLTPSVRSHWRV